MTIWRDTAGREESNLFTRYSAGDLVALLISEWPAMAVVFATIAFIGLLAAFGMKKTYTAGASLLVGIGQEYVYQPSLSDAGRGAVPLNDTMVASEKELLLAEPLRLQVLKQLGPGYVFPSLAKKYERASPSQKQAILEQAADGMLKDLNIDTAPADPVLRVSYKAYNADVAAKTLNALLDDYMASRGTALLSGADANLLVQKQLFQQQLDQANDAYQTFLASNDVGDFAAAKAALTAQLQVATGGQYDSAAKLAAARAQLTAMAGEVKDLPVEVSQYRDINSATADQLNQLRAQREQLAQAWAPGSAPLTEIDGKIAALQGAAAAGRGDTEGTRRVGANPVYQSAQTDEVTLVGQVAALVKQKAAYDSQVTDIKAKLLHLAELEPQFNQLSADRDLKQSNFKDISAKTLANSANQHLADAVTIAERASPPVRGASLRKPVLILAVLFAGFTALMAGLLRAFLRPGLPTPGVAERTLDLPILATARARAA